MEFMYFQEKLNAFCCVINWVNPRRSLASDPLQRLVFGDVAVQNTWLNDD